MKICVIGDIVGRSGRDAVEAHLPKIRAHFSPDLVIANADNASHGLGVTPIVAKELYSLGIDLLTGGDHVSDNKDMLLQLDREPWVLRSLNYPDSVQGKGFHILTTKAQKKCLVIHLQGRIFLDKQSDNPFLAADKLLQNYSLGKNIDAIIVDFHAEATSEKNAMAHYLDGRVSAIVGTHTHIPTADAIVLDKGTGNLTDIGMTGDYNGVIGFEKQGPIQAFRHGFRIERQKPAEAEGTLCAVIIETDDITGLAKTIVPVRAGGFLSRGVPFVAL